MRPWISNAGALQSSSLINRLEHYYFLHFYVGNALVLCRVDKLVRISPPMLLHLRSLVSPSVRRSSTEHTLIPSTKHWFGFDFSV